MLDSKLYNLRRERKISQEDLAIVLNTSRQAISKWERGESSPDLNNLIDLAKFFNVSIDYLLDYEVDLDSCNEFISKLQDELNNKTFNISIDDIKTQINKNGNNYSLLTTSANYLFELLGEKIDPKVGNLLLKCAKKAIIIYKPSPNNAVSIDSLHHLVAFAYLAMHEPKKTKEYIIENNLTEIEALLCECEIRLGNDETATQNVSNLFLKSLIGVFNANFAKIYLLCKYDKFNEAYDLSKWTLSLIQSAIEDNSSFFDIKFLLTFINTVLEKTLHLDYSKNLKYLKENNKKIDDINQNIGLIKSYDYKGMSYTSTFKITRKDFLNDIKTFHNPIIYQNTISILNELKEYNYEK